MTSILEVKRITKKFNKKKALNQISFKVPKGSIFAFLGPNGAGKSTTMNILTNLIKPDSGEISLEGKLLKNRNKDKLGIVFQFNTLDDDLTILENLYCRGLLYSIQKKELTNRILELSDKFKMNSFLNKKYKECSGGQKRIAMIIRALIINPNILILDEPTVNLDPETRKFLWETILSLNKEKNLTIFFSTHYLEEAINANYICVLNQGNIIFEGSFDKLINENSIKKLMIKEKNKEYSLPVLSALEAINYLKKIPSYHLTSFSLSDSSLEEIFIKLIKEEK